MPYLRAAGHQLEYDWIEAGVPGTPVLVFLHQGLGSVGQWRDFPRDVARSTGCAALVYARYGYGQSDVLAEERVPVSFMHDEALRSLPQVLAARGIAEPLLVGHSDGASIALIHAGAGHAARGVIAMAPHVFVEDISVASIGGKRLDFEYTDVARRMAKYHRDPRRTFFLWNDVWLDPAFRGWNIEAYLPGIRCPLLLIQGEDDEYGTVAQIDAIRRQVSGTCEVLLLPECGHSPVRDQPDAVFAAVTRFVAGLS